MWGAHQDRQRCRFCHKARLSFGTRLFLRQSLMHLFSHINALLVATFISLMNLPQVTQADDLITTSTLSRIAFGSCNSEQKPQPLWPVIAQDKPSLWIWTGDASHPILLLVQSRSTADHHPSHNVACPANRLLVRVLNHQFHRPTQSCSLA